MLSLECIIIFFRLNNEEREAVPLFDNARRLTYSNRAVVFTSI